jgi:uncharacterized membrane protein
MSDRDGDVLLDTVLRPSPPLSAEILGAILGVVALINFVFALSFVLRGAWPIAPFLGLDVALLAWAFRATRIAAKREEHVTLTRALLRIVFKPAKKGAPEVSMNPYWVRVDMAEPMGRASQLTLWSHGKGLRIGSFLAPAERALFAQRLNTALSRAKSELP